MGDTSDITQAGAALSAGDGAAPAVAKYSWRAWIVAHWRGELLLGEAFWSNGVILNLVISLVDWGLGRLSGDEPHWLWSIVLIPLGVFEITVPIWQVVGVWRSARHFRGRRLHDGRYVGRWLWSIAACIVSATWAVWPLAAAVGIFMMVVEAFG